MSRPSNTFIPPPALAVAGAIWVAIALFAPRTVLALELRDERDCVIVPHRVVDVSSTVPGLLESVSIERSDLVTRNQELARLESAAERATVVLADAWASISSEIRLESISHDLDNRRKQRVDRLFDRQAIALDDKDQAETDASLAQVRLRQAREKRWIRELDAKKAEALLERRTVRSPIDGVVVERFRSAGEYVENQPIARIAQLDPLQVETLLPMREFGNMHKGMQAIVRAEHNPDITYTATVSVVDRMGDAASGTFGVQLSLPNPDHRIPAGLKCTLSFLPMQATAPAAADSMLATDKPGADNVNDEKAQQTAAVSAPLTQDVAQGVTEPVLAPATDPLSAETAGITEKTELTGLNAPAPDNATASAPLPSQVSTTHQLDQQPNEASAPVAEAAAAAATTSPLCQSIGPLPSKHTAHRVMNQMSGDATQATVHEADTRVTVGYIVVSPPAVGDSAQHVQRMRDAGVHDLLLMPAGEFRGLVSLGVYVQASAAERRRAQIATLGFKAEVRSRTRSERRWWVTLRSGDQSLSLRTAGKVLQSLPEAAGAQVLPCASGQAPSPQSSVKHGQRQLSPPASQRS